MNDLETKRADIKCPNLAATINDGWDGWSRTEGQAGCSGFNCLITKEINYLKSFTYKGFGGVCVNPQGIPKFGSHHMKFNFQNWGYPLSHQYLIRKANGK